MINEASEGKVRRASYRSPTKLLKLIQNRVKVSNTQPRGFKKITNRGKRVPKRQSVSYVRRTIHTTENPRRLGRIKKASCCNVILVCDITFKVHSWTPRENQTINRTRGSKWNMRKKPSLFKVSESWGGEDFVLERKSTSGDWSQINIVRLWTVVGRESPLQFQDKIFIDAREAWHSPPFP